MGMRFFARWGALSVAVGALLAGCATPPEPVSSGGGPSRSIALVHPASGEQVAVTYYRPPAGYDRTALAEISMLFRDRRTNELAPIDPGLVDSLTELRDRLGLPPETAIHVTSGYRSAATNASLAHTNGNVAENSYHIRGQAADIHIPGVPPRRLFEEAAAMQRGGHAVYPHSGHVHVDTGPVRTWTPKGGGPAPRDPDAIMEARAIMRPKAEPPAAKAPPHKAPPKVEVARAPVKPAYEPVKLAKAGPDLSKAKLVLAQLRDTPAPVKRR